MIMEDTIMDMPVLLAEETGAGYELPPAGTWQGVCYSVIDLGTQKEEFEGTIKDAHKVRIGFEFSADTEDEEEKIFTIHKEFTLSFGGRSKLRQFIDAWNGGETTMTEQEAKGFNVYSLLGKEASVNIVRKKSAKGKEYADIGGLSPRIKKLALHERKNENTWLHLSDKYFNEEVFDKLPNFVKEKIQEGKEYRAMYGLETLSEQEVNMKKEAETKEETPESAAAIFGE